MGERKGNHAAKAEPKGPLKGRATAFLVRHPWLTGTMLAVLTFLCLVVLLWYTIFSGLASSADFIYSNF